MNTTNKRGIMKALLVLVSILLVEQTAFAKKGELPEEADYIVPTSPELVPYSRFKLKIDAPYTGDSSKSITYVFPAELTGVENYTITLSRVGDSNTWESPELTAVCVESGTLFSCNVYVKKAAPPLAQESSVIKSRAFQFAQSRNCGGSFLAMSSEFSGTFIDESAVTGFLKNKGLSEPEFQAQLGVAKAFACSEPIGGILSYEFK